MKISRKLAVQILKYCFLHKDFYFPFLVVCKEYSLGNDNFIEIEPSEWETIDKNRNYKTFELWENLQNLDDQTLNLMAKGFIDKITNKSLENDIEKLAKKYRSEWRKELWESKDIEEFGENEFFGGRADAAEDCLDIIRDYNKQYEK
jgi:hypothetical protein